MAATLRPLVAGIATDAAKMRICHGKNRCGGHNSLDCGPAITQDLSACLAGGVVSDRKAPALLADVITHELHVARIAAESFNGQFWNEATECLYDVVNGERKDPAIRPNQIFAVSLPYSMLEKERARKVVEKVEADLFTPFGLRSLSPNDPAYTPRYIGSPVDRDATYHQGTIWSWLIGPFVDAYRKVYPGDQASSDKVEGTFSSFKKHLSQGMIGQVSEIFDADPPHAPRGCAAGPYGCRCRH